MRLPIFFLCVVCACASGGDEELDPDENRTDGGSDSGTGTGANLIDDLDDGDGAIDEVQKRIGAWYTFNDASATGKQTPIPNKDFVPAAGGRDTASKYCAQTAGNGFSLWGAGMGFDLNNPGTTKSKYDASAHTGIAFWAKGNVSIRFVAPELATVPKTYGGACEPGTKEGEECDDAHGKSFLLSDKWELYKVPFDQLKQEGWGKKAAFDAATLLGMQFRIGKSVTFDVSVDEIGFY
jgi:hypothetical protein